jgi:hypothetical protein
MADNPNLKGRDKNRIDADQPYEVEYVHRQFPNLSRDEIIEAIRSKGPDRSAVITFLEKRNQKRKQGADGSM